MSRLAIFKDERQRNLRNRCATVRKTLRLVEQILNHLQDRCRHNLKAFADWAGIDRDLRKRTLLRSDWTHDYVPPRCSSSEVLQSVVQSTRLPRQNTTDVLELL